MILLYIHNFYIQKYSFLQVFSDISEYKTGIFQLIKKVLHGIHQASDFQTYKSSDVNAIFRNS